MVIGRGTRAVTPRRSCRMPRIERIILKEERKSVLLQIRHE